MTVAYGPWPGSVPSHRQGTPPTAEYLAARERLGMPSRPSVIARPCSWCGAGPAAACRVRGTGRYRQPHDAREAAA